jgi:wyosine [tRNA(Phe)-imidazoG37] synthetase (radical SAM superfamily)
MAGFLFNDIVFGPVMSRRLGISLGINLLPLNKKVCSFNCIYCECGWTDTLPTKEVTFFSPKEISTAIESRFVELHNEHIQIEAITFAGNGEPTLHPDFDQIIENTLLLRDKYLTGAEVTVLSNSTTISQPLVLEALKKADKSIMKLDAGDDELFRLINQPLTSISRDEIISNLKLFKSKVIIQSMFLKGEYKGRVIDNTRDDVIDLWIEELKQIQPEYVMIYPIARNTPVEGLKKISTEELNIIAVKVNKEGIKAKIYP